MEVDKTIVILATALILVLGIFAISSFGDASTPSSAVSYAGQYAGGGCGR